MSMPSRNTPFPPCENSSGHGDFTNVPNEVRRWNWGAFLLTWIWGIGNNAMAALLVFVPVIGIFIPFWLGYAGNELAWRSRWWPDVPTFHAVQRKWALAGAIVTGAVILLLAAGLALQFQTNTQAKAESDKWIEMIRSDEASMKILGSNAEFHVIGGISVSFGDGSSQYGDVTMFATGSNGSFDITLTRSADGDITRIDIFEFEEQSNATSDAAPVRSFVPAAR